MSSQLVICCALLLSARTPLDFENGKELGYPANSNHEEVAGHSYRSGKTGGVGVPAGGGAVVDAAVGDGMAGQGNGVLRRQNVFGTRPCDDATLVRECWSIAAIRADRLWPWEPGRSASVQHEVLPRSGIVDCRGGDFRVARADKDFRACRSARNSRAGASCDHTAIV